MYMHGVVNCPASSHSVTETEAYNSAVAVAVAVACSRSKYKGHKTNIYIVLLEKGVLQCKPFNESCLSCQKIF